MDSIVRQQLRPYVGGKIDSPGIYSGVPMDIYHSQCTSGWSLSSTDIRRIILHSPAAFWKASNLNPNMVDEEEKAHLILGRAAHHLLLGEADFKGHFVIRPSMAPDGKAWNGNNLSCKKWMDDRKAEGITVLTQEQIETIKGMAGLLPWQKGMLNCGLLNTPIVRAGALSGEIECSLFWPQTDRTWLKVRPDAIPGDSNDYSDLKSVGRSGVDYRSLSTAVYEHGYFIQGALVGMASKRVLDRQMTGFHDIFVDTGDVHAVSVRTLDESDLIRGERAVFLGVSIFERCMETGVWPGPTSEQADAMKLSIPGWASKEFDEKLDRLEMEYPL